MFYNSFQVQSLSSQRLPLIYLMGPFSGIVFGEMFYNSFMYIIIILTAVASHISNGPIVFHRASLYREMFYNSYYHGIQSLSPQRLAPIYRRGLLYAIDIVHLYRKNVQHLLLDIHSKAVGRLLED
ncbi:hypothetical protein DPMN_176697 [Dreissena polymorpha]|uniref:Uncharacterized protein n=1 Tax=Dreissena polymorpha TaxID=45954 RepID=A0A9D4IH54_DREPO|nr:hypothetical protein DPMN_176697 [Dreissena polymorpha]